jgi:hypothetical protein
MKKLIIILLVALATACVPCGCTKQQMDDLDKTAQEATKPQVVYTSSNGDKVIYLPHVLGPGYPYIVEDKDGNIKAITSH